MLNRHFLRAKALQALYAYEISNSSDKADIEKKMLNGINKLFDLQVYLLSSILEIQSLAQEQIDDAKQKYLPTEEDLNPNLKFINNKVISQLSNNIDLQKEILRLKINWTEAFEILRGILNRFKKSDSYKDYMSKPETTYDEDRLIIVQLFKNYVIKNEQLYDYICEKELNWEVDYEVLIQYVLKFLKDFQENDSKEKRLPRPLERSEKDENLESDKDFLLNIFRKTIEEEDELEEMIKKRIQNWEMERIAILDIIIIKMGLIEFMHCPTIPIRVSLNEYIELSKEFSTEKSKLFVNGLLDKLVVDLRAAGRVKKTEKGIETLENYE